jgi:hypothetical protein
VDYIEWSECTLATIKVPAIMFSRCVKHYHHWLPVRSGLNNQLLVQQVSSKVTALLKLVIKILIKRVLGELMFIYYKMLLPNVLETTLRIFNSSHVITSIPA